MPVYTNMNNSMKKRCTCMYEKHLLETSYFVLL